MTRTEWVVEDYCKILDQVKNLPINISDMSLQMITQSLLSISITLAQILDVMTGDDAEDEE